MKYVITTVGTSIFTNYLDNKEDSQLKIWYETIENKPMSEYKNKILQQYIQNISITINKWAKNNKAASAEIKSLLKIKDILQDDINVVLLTTDTVESNIAAKIIADCLTNYNISVFETEVIPDLQISNAAKFEKNGMPNLVEKINSYFNKYYKDNFILNITGGYKAIIPYMTIMAQIYNIPLYYIFSNTDELIKIPQAPIYINFEMFAKYSNVINLLEKGIEENWNDIKRKYNVGDDFSACIWEEDNMAELNAIGKMFYNIFKNYLIIKVYKGSDFFNTNSGNKNLIIKTIKELYNRLVAEINSNSINSTEQLLNHINNLTDKNDLRHGTNPDKNIFIFKSTAKDQERLVYSVEINNNVVFLYLYDYVRGNFTHEKYIDDFKKKFSIKKYMEFISIPIKKEEYNV